MPLSPEMHRWLTGLPEVEIRKLAAFDGKSLNLKASISHLAGLGDDGLRTLDARFRAVPSEPPPPPVIIPDPPSEAPPPPPVPHSPEAVPNPTADAEGAGDIPERRSPTATDLAVSPFAPVSPKGGEITQESAAAPVPKRADMWCVRLRNLKVLECGLNRIFVRLDHKRFSRPLPRAFVEHLEAEFGPDGVRFEIVPAPAQG